MKKTIEVCDFCGNKIETEDERLGKEAVRINIAAAPGCALTNQCSIDIKIGENTKTISPEGAVFCDHWCFEKFIKPTRTEGGITDD